MSRSINFYRHSSGYNFKIENEEKVWQIQDILEALETRFEVNFDKNEKGTSEAELKLGTLHAHCKKTKTAGDDYDDYELSVTQDDTCVFQAKRIPSICTIDIEISVFRPGPWCGTLFRDYNPSFLPIV